jgi:hypothetical protein
MILKLNQYSDDFTF